MIVASMASLSSRVKLLEQTVASLLPQVDAVCVYLNGYPRVPDCLKQPKVLHAVLSVDAGWRGAEAKLWFWDGDEFVGAPRWQPDDVALICDDDIVYPVDYAEQMTAALARRPGTIACVHGSIMTEPFVRYAESRMVARTVGSLDRDTQVHIPGTGTMAFRYGDMAGVLEGALRRDFVWSHAVDPHVAVICHRQSIPIWSVARPPRWLVTPPHPTEGMEIFSTRTGVANDVAETAILKGAGPWPTLPVAADMTQRGVQVRGVAAIGHQRQKRREIRPKIPVNPNSMLPAQAFAFLEQRLRHRHMESAQGGGYVIELGSGHGTARLLALAGSAGVTVVSVEHDPKFIGLVGEARYIHAPIHDGWYDARTLGRRLPPKDHIVAVIIDGPPNKIGRSKVADHLSLFPDKVPILIDDVHRDSELELARRIAAARGYPEVVVHNCGDRAFATLGWD
jgi:hypothetical protein